ncbi:MAG: rubrerythrin family protein [Desulfobacteraceae bacterium]|nr:MAG: rubrerythrin family protein [Desulfobacteraceae bacterium]
MPITGELKERLIEYQRNEITESRIYRRLARTIEGSENRRILEKIAEDELGHYRIWRTYTHCEVEPKKLKVWGYYLISRIFGFTFGIKLMEGGEEQAQKKYGQIPKEVKEADSIARDENEHENALIAMLDEERLRYIGSVVLGLNDALVELTGALAGFTLAFQETRLVALTGSITGIAAALSMGASEYLSTKSEESVKGPIKAAVYTGCAYVVAVVVLILPYLVIDHLYASLLCSLAAAVSLIALFNYYISVAKGVPFRRRFFEMSGISLGVAAVSFLSGYLLRSWLGVDV